ncbi:MAG: InlB B-repeat-containing protein [Propionibacteriaceae bacterium]|nr:InlB B-repeat-containing protein [Propionibacteriaceae bacterium]
MQSAVPAASNSSDPYTGYAYYQFTVDVSGDYTFAAQDANLQSMSGNRWVSVSNSQMPAVGVYDGKGRAAFAYNNGAYTTVTLRAGVIYYVSFGVNAYSVWDSYWGYQKYHCWLHFKWYVTVKPPKPAPPAPTPTPVSQFVVKYDAATNGGTTSAGSVWVKAGSPVDLTPKATRPGWEFVGWNTNRYATSGMYSMTMPASNVTLYAIFVYCPPAKSYVVSYDANGGSTSAKSVSVTVGYPVDLSPKATRSGYNFVGWNTNRYATTALWTLVMPANNVTLYAIWDKCPPPVTLYAVTYDAASNGGSTNAFSQAVAPGAKVDLTPKATKPGWTFMGWNTNRYATTGLTSMTMPSSNVYLYAIFQYSYVYCPPVYVPPVWCYGYYYCYSY